MSSDLSGFSMMELFRMEAESHTATLSAGLVSLEGTAAAPEVIDPLMRAAHSLKGAARDCRARSHRPRAHMRWSRLLRRGTERKARSGPEHVDILLRGALTCQLQVAQLGEPR